MFDVALGAADPSLPVAEVLDWLAGLLIGIKNYGLVIVGFSVLIFFHEMGHFLAAKWCDVRVHKFAIGFGRAICSYRRGMGVRWGSSYEDYRQRLEQHVKASWSPEQRLDEQAVPTESELTKATTELKLGETEYCINVLPLGGYVKMLGQDDFEIDKSDEIRVKANPRSFTNKSIGQRMVIVSAGVTMNLIVAAVLFMITFMVGLDKPPAVVGLLMPDSPAAQAGLQIGDRIVSINGKPVGDFDDAQSSVLFADPDLPLNLVVERKQPEGTLKAVAMSIYPTKSPDDGRLLLGIAPAMTNVVVQVNEDPRIPPEQRLQGKDEVLEVNGQKVTSFYEIWMLMARKAGEWVSDKELSRAGSTTQPARPDSGWSTLKVRRPDPSGSGPGQVLDVKSLAHMAFMPTGEKTDDSGHLLGFVPRRRVLFTEPGGGADQAGIRAGDILVRWGQTQMPSLKAIQASVREGESTPVSVVVERWTGQTYETLKPVTVQPHRSGGWGGDWKAGLAPGGQEEDQLIVAEIVPRIRDEIDTPAAAVQKEMPPGSRITRVNGEPVQTWVQLRDRFLRRAGSDVQISWLAPGEAKERSHGLHIPHTIGTTFKLPADHCITSIAGLSKIELQEKGQTKSYAASDWFGAMKILKSKMGETVKIEHRSLFDPKTYVETVTVTPEMLDTWVMRLEHPMLAYHLDIERATALLTKVQERNPLSAMMLGVKKTWYFVELVYVMGKRMLVTKSIKMDQVSGPVGIVELGADIAQRDFILLLFYMGMLSANLAVINFLPFPIVDGGLFLFLVIEKIKGSPLNLKVQMVTQVIGLAVIVSVFVLVTFKDISQMHWFRQVFG